MLRFLSIIVMYLTTPVVAEYIEEPQYSVEVIVNWFPEGAEAHLISTYVYNEYGLDYLQLLNAENWAFTKERQHPLWYDRCIKRIDKASNNWVKAKLDKLGTWQYFCHWTRETFHDNWLCGISDYYHPTVVNDPRFLTNRKRQADQCVRLKKEWTRFYGRDHRIARAVNKFTFIIR